MGKQLQYVVRYATYTPMASRQWQYMAMVQ